MVDQGAGGADPEPLTDAVVEHVRERIRGHLASRLNKQSFGAELARQTGESEDRIQQVLTGRRRLEVRDLVVWALSTGLDLFDVLPRERSDLLPPDRLPELPPKWIPGSGRVPKLSREPIRRITEAVEEAVRAYVSDYDARFLRAEIIRAAVLSALVSLRYSLGEIDFDVAATTDSVRHEQIDKTVSLVAEVEASIAVDVHVVADHESTREAVFVAMSSFLALAEFPASTRMALLVSSERHNHSIISRLDGEDEGSEFRLAYSQWAPILGDPRPGIPIPTDVLLTRTRLDLGDTSNLLGELFVIKSGQL